VLALGPQCRLRSASSQLGAAFQKPLISLLDAIIQRNLRLPTQCLQPGGIQKLSWSPIGLCRIKDEVNLKTNDPRNNLHEFANSQILTATNVDDFG